MSNDSDAVGEALEREVSELRELAVTSTDPGVVARAIAAGDGEVRDALRRKLDAGFRLTGVTSTREAGRGHQRVVFAFEPSEGTQVSMVSRGVMALVDVADGTVIRVVEEHVSAPGGGDGTAEPFVLATPSMAGRTTAGPEEFAVVERERAFLDDLGIESPSPDMPTVIGTGSWSGNPPRVDETRSDRDQISVFTAARPFD